MADLEYATVWSAPAKKPAGRTKFRETRHPLYRGVRRRGAAGRWVCELRVPGGGSARVWLGTYATAELAARAHDAAAIALKGKLACLNFADSAWRLKLPPSFSSHAELRRAVAAAVDEIQREGESSEESCQSSSSLVVTVEDDDSSTEHSSDQDATAAAVLAVDAFEFLAGFGDVGAGLYYASLAEGLLLQPPPGVFGFWSDADCGAAGEIDLWNH